MKSIITQNERYALAAKAFGRALGRLAKAYEADPARRDDLLQDIHMALWRSMGGFDEKCSMRTWTYRVAHNIGASHVLKETRKKVLMSLDDIEVPAASPSPEDAMAQRHAVARLTTLIQSLKPADRQIMVLYLEDIDAAEIAEITGLSAGAVAVRIHRAKAAMTRAFQGGGHND